VKLEATGDIRGLVFARENIDLNALQNVSVTALAQGSVSVGAGGNISGTIVGVGSVSASGDVSSSQVGFGAGNAAGTASQSLANDDQSKGVAAKEDEEDDAPKKQIAAGPKLTRTVGRVTVILPTAPGRN
jgi:hypothetical protein